jgi:hypothetical protein
MSIADRAIAEEMFRQRQEARKPLGAFNGVLEPDRGDQR